MAIGNRRGSKGGGELGPWPPPGLSKIIKIS